jgi:NAD(P)-dependent dehydrogenase (short-subunit alcohol dehydrogenase family)
MGAKNSTPTAGRLFDLTGRTALITGSSQGLGFTVARGLAQAGAAVVLNGRDKKKLTAAAEVLRGEGAKKLSVQVASSDKLPGPKREWPAWLIPMGCMLLLGAAYGGMALVLARLAA